MGGKRNKSGRVATEAKDHSIHGNECKTTKRIRYLELSPNVNDYDTGETKTHYIKENRKQEIDK